MTTSREDQLPAKRNCLKRLETYEVEKRQFDSIEGEATNIGGSFAMATACIPVAITLNVTLFTVPISDNSKATCFWGLMWACYFLGLFFGVSAWTKRGRLKQIMKEIKDNQVPPVAAKEEEVVSDLTAVSDPAESQLLSTQTDDGEEN